MKRKRIYWLLILIIVIISVFFFIFFGTSNFSFSNIKLEDVKNEKAKVSLYLNENDQYYLLLPKLFNRKKLKINIKNNIKKYKIYAYDEQNNYLGKLTNNKVTNIFEYDKVILKLKNGNKLIDKCVVNVMQSTLPSIYLNINGGDRMYEKIVTDENHNINSKGEFLLSDNQNNFSSVKIKKIRGRGNATWLRAKKPFQIKLKEKISILGMNPSKTWLLISDHNDGSLSRNYLWFKLAQKLKLNYSVECEPVDVYINDKYQGSYLITSKVEANKNRVDINKNEYLLEIDNKVDDYQIKTKEGYVITVKNPDLDEININKRKRILEKVKKKIDKIEKIIFNDCDNFKELEKYINLESFAKFYWVQEISENFDAIRGSNYMYFKDNILYMGPIWDMDDTLNRSYNFSDVDEYYILENEALNNRIYTNWYRQLMKKKQFSDLVDKIYIDNFKEINSMEVVLQKYIDIIKKSAEMNYIRWSYDSMVSSQLKEWISGDWDFESSTRILNNSLHNRLKWYRSQYYNINYDYLEYQLKDKYGNEFVGKIETDIVLLPNTINLNETIKIYGIHIKDNKKEQIDTVELDNGEVEKIIELNQDTLSQYKKNNTNYYKVSFKINN